MARIGLGQATRDFDLGSLILARLEREGSPLTYPMTIEPLIRADEFAPSVKRGLPPIAMADFPAVIDLASLNGINGFRLDGINPSDLSGYSVASAGDVNGDGFGDLIIGASAASPNGVAVAGESYVVFGKAGGFAASIDLANLDGANGFRLHGIDAVSFSGGSVASAGDVNGDGFHDVIIGAANASANDPYSGQSYVFFGKAGGFSAAFDLASLDGMNGFRLDGIDAYDFSGGSVASAGDVNGDGFGDIIIGAMRADPDGNSQAGESYVVFGKTGGFTANFDLASLNGFNGFRLDGTNSSDLSGRSVASAGDVNGDGFGDLIIGARGADPNGDSYAGESYVVFGKVGGFSASLDLASLDGINGFRLDGIDPDDRSGWSVASAGDVNGDGFDDIIVGAPYANSNRESSAGESYVIFGQAGVFSASLDLASLDGTNGFRLDGIDPREYSGLSVASAGDFNGDGVDDLIIGAYAADPNGYSGAGESYVVFGRVEGFAASLDLSALDGTKGFRLDGTDAGDSSGGSVASAGDVNGDGFGDLIIGAWGANDYAGESYVVFGRPSSDGIVDRNPVLEMIRLAVEVYGPHEGFHLAEALAGTSEAVPEQTIGVTLAAQDRNWGALTAEELGIATLVQNPDGLSYAYAGGHYQAIGLDGFGDDSEANAIVLRAIIDGEITLAIAFRGTDQFADSVDYPDFDAHYAKFAPLISAIDAYLAGAGSDVQQVLVSGHSLGGAMAQHFMADHQGDPRFRAFTVGSPGGDNAGGDDDDPNIVNYGHTGDPVFRVAFLSLLKDHQGSSVLISSEVSQGFDLDEHDRWLYLNDLQRMFDFAIAGGPFAGSALGISIAAGETYSGRAVQVAVGNTNDGLPENISIGARDNWVLGSAGNDIFTWVIYLKAVLHNVEGGAGNDLLQLPGSARDWELQAVGDGYELSMQGQVVGNLTGVERLRFLGEALTEPIADALSNMSSTDALIIYLDGNVPNFSEVSLWDGVEHGEHWEVHENDLFWSGGAGKDRLHGGRGDEFIFGADSANDQILNNIGTAAEDANDRLIYDDATGKLFFDADGTGTQAQVLIATLSDAPTIGAGDFVVI